MSPAANEHEQADYGKVADAVVTLDSASARSALRHRR
jgi:hypothetical protein